MQLWDQNNTQIISNNNIPCSRMHDVGLTPPSSYSASLQHVASYHQHAEGGAQCPHCGLRRTYFRSTRADSTRDRLRCIAAKITTCLLDHLTVISFEVSAQILFLTFILALFLSTKATMLSSDAKKSIIIVSILTPLSTAFVVLRLLKKQKLLGLDDWLLCFAVLLLYLQAAGAILFASKGGEGKQMSDLSADELKWLFKMEYWPELSYTILIATIKISVLISYNWIFGRLKWFRYTIYTLGLLTLIWFFGVFFSVLFQCTPVDKAWQPMKPGHCINFTAFLWANSISNTVLDYLILLSPVVPVLRLQMGAVQKLVVLLSFFLGSLASISSTMRVVQTRTVDETNLSGTVFKDSIWTYIEPSAGVISACLPYLANIFGQKLLEFLRGLRTLGSRTTSFLRIRSRTDYHKSDTSSFKAGTQRATHESYELGDDNKHVVSQFKKGAISQESVRQLV